MQLLRSPRGTLAVATVVPLLLALCVVLIVYVPGLPGSPPRSIGRVLFWIPPVTAVLLLQLFPFGSWVVRSLATVAFAGAMFYALLMVMFFGACSFGDCM